MLVSDYINSRPDGHFRVIRYVPAPDALDKDGNLICGGEGTSTVVFDSTVSGDFPPDLLWKEITAINEGDDGVPEVEYMPDEYYTLF